MSELDEKAPVPEGAEPASPQTAAARPNTNLRTGIICGVFVCSMVGMAYASVPFYTWFCKATGYGGTTQRVEQVSDRILDRKITIRFDANTSGGIPWSFEPDQREVTVKLGETAKIGYTAKNLFDTPTGGRATFNVVPELAGSYFNKIECFCFTDTRLKPGQTLDMPVVFFVDPAILDEPDLKDVRTITLSYTMFPIDAKEPAKAASVVTGAEKTGG